MEIHLDPVGGLAGDMFIAALLHAFPELEAGVLGAIAAVEPGLARSCRLQAHRDHVLQGARFLVGEESSADPAGHGPRREGSSPAHHHPHHNGHHPHDAAAHAAGDDAHRRPPQDDHRPHDHHGHTSWATIRARLGRADLAPEVRTHAVGIFAELARAEARVHGIAVDAVAFHEVGAADSIADVVGAAALIAALGGGAGEGRWTVAALPLGSGQVRTAHGFLPVPAPATALLLEGFLTWDDGVPGERVTPTGAAILRYLRARPPAVDRRPPRVLRRSGVGFGARTLPGRSNCLRVLAFENAGPAPGTGLPEKAEEEDVVVIEFEVDDQSPEDLALGLECLRAEPAVLDVLQTMGFGKKGRLVACVRVLARPEAADAVIAACFRETTTLGLRRQTVGRVALARRAEEIEIEGRTFRVKTTDRPGGVGRTAKLEAADLGGVAGGQGERTRLRAAAERAVLERKTIRPLPAEN